MPSTYSSSLRLELMAQGENANTWGNKTNTNLDKIEQAIAGYRSVDISGSSSVYLSVVNASATSDSPGRNAFIILTGTLTSAISVIVPDETRGYWLRNDATGASVTFRTSGGTGFNLPGGRWLFAISNGTTVVNTEVQGLYAQLSAANTFTNLNTFTSALTINTSVSVSGSMVITGQTDLRGSVSVSGTSTFRGPVVVSGVATFTSATTFNTSVSISNSLVVAGQTDLRGAVSVSGTSTFRGPVVVSGAATFTSAVTFNTSVSISNSLQVAGPSTFTSALTVNTSVSVSGSLVVRGPVTFSSTVDVSATTTFYDQQVIRPLFKDYALVHNILATVSTSINIDLTLGNYISAYVAGSTSFVFLNPPGSPNAGGFVLELTNGGSFPVSWPAAVRWNEGLTPVLTSAGIDILTFISDNGGTIWIGNRPIRGIV